MYRSRNAEAAPIHGLEGDGGHGLLVDAFTQAMATSTATVPSRLRVLLLPDAKATERGILYRRGGQAFLLAWARISRAYAAVLDESQLEGGPTMLFDLVVESEGVECTVCRIRVHGQGEAANRIARALRVSLGAGACSAEIAALAEEMEPARRFPDEEAFRDAVLESIRWDRACALDVGSDEPGWLRGTS